MKEDFTKYTTVDIPLIGPIGKAEEDYFTATLSTTFSGSETVVQAGKTYKYDGSGWVEQPAQQA